MSGLLCTREDCSQERQLSQALSGLCPVRASSFKRAKKKQKHAPKPTTAIPFCCKDRTAVTKLRGRPVAKLISPGPPGRTFMSSESRKSPPTNCSGKQRTWVTRPQSHSTSEAAYMPDLVFVDRVAFFLVLESRPEFCLALVHSGYQVMAAKERQVAQAALSTHGQRRKKTHFSRATRW